MNTKHSLLLSKDLIEKLLGLYPYDFSISQPELGSLFKHFSVNQELSPLHQGMAWIAKQHHVDWAFLSSSGTTALNCMMVATLSDPNDTILIQRDSHTSLLSGIIQVGAKVKYIQPVYSVDHGLSFGIDPSELEKTLRENPDIGTVILTYPNYFGIATDIHACGEIIRRYGKRFGIDSAHGAYFAYHPQLPRAAESSGADIVTLSNHKTNATLGQGSVALIQNQGLIGRWYEVANALGYITTSFSYPILASIMLGEILLAQQGYEDIERAISICNHLRERIQTELKPLSCISFTSSQGGFHQFDPLRLTIDVSKLGLTGFKVAEMLIDSDEHIYPEMETLNHVLLLFNLYDTQSSADRLFNALAQIVKSHSQQSVIPYLQLAQFVPQKAMEPRDAFYIHPSQKRKVKIQESLGKISAETISCYPPGSAIIVAGEVISPEALEFLVQNKRQGGTLKGASDSENFEYIHIIY